MSYKRINFSDRKEVKSGDIEKENNSLRRQIGLLSSRLDDIESLIGSLDGASIRRGRQLVSAGTNSIKFKSPLSTTTYSILKPYLSVSASESGDVTINEQQRGGFTCYCSDAGMLHYIVIE